MKKTLSFALVLTLLLALASPAAISAAEAGVGVKMFVPVGANGAPLANNTVPAGGNLAADVYFKYVGPTEPGTTINVIGMDIDTKGGDLTQFPFDPTSSTYYVGLGGVAVGDGSIVGPYRFNMRCRGDAAAGYYGVDFVITYERTVTTVTETSADTPSDPSGGAGGGISRSGGTGDTTPPTTETKTETFVETTVVPWDVLITDGEGASDPSVGTVPKVLITSFSTNPSSVVAGEDFTLNVTFKNTSSSNTIENLKAVLGSDGTFTPVSGSSTMFIQHLDPGATSSLSMTLHVKADASPGSYAVKFAMTFDAPGVKDPIVDEESLSIPVVQVPKINVTSIQTMGNAMVGSDLNVMSSVNNTGKSVLYNVMAKVYDTGGLMSSEESYLGNIQPGESKNIDVYLSGMSAGDTAIVIMVSYEDETGKSFETEVTSDVTISEPMVYEDPWADDMPQPVEEEQGLAWWIYAIIGVAVAGIAAIIAVNVIKKKKARARDLAAAKALDEKYLNDTGDRL